MSTLPNPLAGDNSDSPGDPDFLTIDKACAIIGGDKPISRATYHRGVAAGRFPAPEHPSPGISRIRRSRLLAAIGGA
jgi:hypothetical protein